MSNNSSSFYINCEEENMLIDFAFLVHGHQIADSEGFEFPRETTPEKLNFQLIV